MDKTYWTVLYEPPMHKFLEIRDKLDVSGVEMREIAPLVVVVVGSVVVVEVVVVDVVVVLVVVVVVVVVVVAKNTFFLIQTY